MSHGAGVHEIFNNQGKNNAFRFEEQESKQQLKLSKKKDSGAQSPMKKFGAYKPKILGGQNDFLEIEDKPTPSTDWTASTVQLRPVLHSAADASHVKAQATNPKPWVIGDKNVPMVLGSVEDDDDDNNNIVERSGRLGANNDDYKTNDFSGYQRPLSISSDTSTLISQSSDNSRQGLDNPVMYENGISSAGASEPKSSVSATATDSKLASSNFFDQQNNEPPPDYDEDEKTLDFNSEDTDDPNDSSDGKKKKHREMRPKSTVKVYDGEDFSHYLSEDEPEQQVQLHAESKGRNTVGRKSKSDSQGPKVNDKHTMFKQQTGKKSKRKNSANTPTFSSVRSFSYADSKYGTKGKSMNKSLSFSELTHDSDVFLSTSSREGSYESFLRSRHGDVLPPEANDVINDIREMNRNAKLAHKDDTVWKKLTVRIKQSINKSAGTKEQ